MLEHKHPKTSFLPVPLPRTGCVASLAIPLLAAAAADLLVRARPQDALSAGVLFSFGLVVGVMVLPTIACLRVKGPFREHLAAWLSWLLALVVLAVIAFACVLTFVLATW